MEKLNYDSSKHMLVHVGDLIAKGSKHDEVLSFMRERRVVGVRGNHDQPVSHVTTS
jgi:predicted phosphodiesterase